MKRLLKQLLFVALLPVMGMSFSATAHAAGQPMEKMIMIGQLPRGITEKQLKILFNQINILEEILRIDQYLKKNPATQGGGFSASTKDGIRKTLALLDHLGKYYITPKSWANIHLALTAVRGVSDPMFVQEVRTTLVQHVDIGKLQGMPSSAEIRKAYVEKMEKYNNNSYVDDGTRQSLNMQMNDAAVRLKERRLITKYVTKWKSNMKKRAEQIQSFLLAD